MGTVYDVEMALTGRGLEDVDDGTRGAIEGLGFEFIGGHSPGTARPEWRFLGDRPYSFEQDIRELAERMAAAGYAGTVTVRPWDESGRYQWEMRDGKVA